MMGRGRGWARGTIVPNGLNSPTESEFHFSYFILLRCPSRNLWDHIAYNFTKEYKM